MLLSLLYGKGGETSSRMGNVGDDVLNACIYLQLHMGHRRACRSRHTYFQAPQTQDQSQHSFLLHARF